MAYVLIARNFFIYIVTNKEKTILETGVTGDLISRIYSLAHGLYDASINTECYQLVYWESFENVYAAVRREREIKSFSLKKKKQIINVSNPEWNFLNDCLHQIVE